MNKPLPDIVCFECGSGQPPWIGPRGTIGYDHEALARLHRDGIIRLAVNGNDAHISGVDRVGILLLPSGRRLVIRSKIECLVLLDWLTYLGDFPVLEVWLADAGVTVGADIHTCLAQLFLREFEKLTRLHFRKDYVSTIANEQTIRGRINVTRLCRTLHRLPGMPQKVRRRSFDTPHNRVLAAAFDRLPLLLDRSIRKDCVLFAGLRDVWSDIGRDMANSAGMVTEAQWACPPGYRTALQLARLILNGASLDPDNGTGGQAFTLSLSSVWERSLRRMIEQSSVETGWRAVSDSEKTRRWSDSASRADPTRMLIADSIVKRNELKWVLDAKYKRDYGDEGRVDRFQMCAYALAFDADRASLVYPLGHIDAEQRTLLHTMVGTKQVRIDSISLPMRSGPKQCRTAFIELCKSMAD